MSHNEPPARPLTIAHRAGNSLTRLREAEAFGADYVEADVWMHRGQLEIRHEKTAGILPLLWDRWSLSPGWMKRLSLSDLLLESQSATHLLLDLKGVNRRLPTMVKRILFAAQSLQPISICSQNWSFVDAFHEHPEITRMYSIGSTRQLTQWMTQFRHRQPFALSIDARLLTPEIVQALRDQSGIIAPWGVKTRQQAKQLLDLGVTAINADDYSLLDDIKRNDFSNTP